MRTRRGGNVIEFALTLPLFVVIVFAVFDYGWYFMTKSVSDIAAARGCRAGAIIDPVDADPSAAAMTEMTSWADLVLTDCQGAGECTVSTLGSVPTRRLVCELDFQFEPLVGLVPTPTTIRSYNVTRMEWQRP